VPCWLAVKTTYRTITTNILFVLNCILFFGRNELIETDIRLLVTERVMRMTKVNAECRRGEERGKDSE